jgi:hypothetical protein
VTPGLLPDAVHDRRSFRGQTPDDGCPSKRARPTIRAPGAISYGGYSGPVNAVTDGPGRAGRKRCPGLRSRGRPATKPAAPLGGGDQIQLHPASTAPTRCAPAAMKVSLGPNSRSWEGFGSSAARESARCMDCARYRTRRCGCHVRRRAFRIWHSVTDKRRVHHRWDSVRQRCCREL